MRRILALGLAVSLLAACGDDGDDPAAGSVSSTSSTAAGSSSSSSTAPATEGVSEGDGIYSPASNVDPHLALGEDVAAIKAAMEPATKGEPVDWAAVGKIFREGTGASKKGDGSIRTLQGLVPGSAQDAFVNAAIDGTGDAAGASDAVRRQMVDKGITVILAEKVIEEYGKARAKMEEGNLEPPSTGAVHNVDEAWAFLVAAGNGPASTAAKRAADFGLEGKVKEPVLQSIVVAQEHSQSGDLAAFDAATEATQEALYYIFYLATFKYLDHDDEVGEAEGLAFYRGISAAIEQADAASHQAIVDAFESGDAAAGRAALNRDPVLAAIGVSAEEKVTGLAGS
ncbi:MAG: hypothetical protein ACRDY7_11355 [Acidimicrobiia bacterium]